MAAGVRREVQEVLPETSDTGVVIGFCQRLGRVTSAAKAVLSATTTDLQVTVTVSFKSKEDMDDLLKFCFMKAVEANDEVAVRRFLRTGFNSDFTETYGATSIMSAAQKGREGLLELLLEEDGIDIDAQNHFGDTALMFAVSSGSKRSVELILAKNPNLELRNGKGRTALNLARDKEIADLIRSKMAESSESKEG